MKREKEGKKGEERKKKIRIKKEKNLESQMREDWSWKENDGDKICATWKQSVIETWNRRIERLKKE